ncbi:MAG: hypothetical protein DMF57_18125 [Acidobacteria bacterium]|nr:MAG: hypothetical protein DMF57_18125 [Acidobacteriota bacterium]
MVEEDGVLTPSSFSARMIALCLILTAVRCATFPAPIPPPTNPTFRALAEDPVVHDCFANILLRGLARQEAESAAWVVLKVDHYECIVWNSTGYRAEVTFHGEMPFGVVAVVHSHPPSLPKASQKDLETARQLNVPIFAVTPLAVWVADPDAGILPVVQNMAWARPGVLFSAAQR